MYKRQAFRPAALAAHLLLLVADMQVEVDGSQREHAPAHADGLRAAPERHGCQPDVLRHHDVAGLEFLHDGEVGRVGSHAHGQRVCPEPVSYTHLDVYKRQALKTVGFLLREYERRYDGLVGRYGGDEFTLLMTDFDDEAELRRVLDELTGRLHVSIQAGGSSFEVHCSVGATVWHRQADADELLEQADRAL